MLSFEKFCAKLDDLYDGKLDVVQQCRMEAHRKTCESCQDAYRKRFREIFCIKKSLFEFMEPSLFELEGCLNEETLLEYLVGSLAPREADYVRKHIEEDGCLSCAFHLERLQGVVTRKPSV